MDKVVHFEIPFDNKDRALKFYRDLFGWKIMQPPGMEGYWLANTVETDERSMPKSPGAINGGFMKRGDDVKTPLLIIKVADIKEAQHDIAKGGGKITLATVPVGDFGLYARFTDCEGNPMGLWQDVKKAA